MYIVINILACISFSFICLLAFIQDTKTSIQPLPFLLLKIGLNHDYFCRHPILSLWSCILHIDSLGSLWNRPLHVSWYQGSDFGEEYAGGSKSNCYPSKSLFMLIPPQIQRTDISFFFFLFFLFFFFFFLNHQDHYHDAVHDLGWPRIPNISLNQRLLHFSSLGTALPSFPSNGCRLGSLWCHSELSYCHQLFLPLPLPLYQDPSIEVFPDRDIKVSPKWLLH